MNTSSPAGNRTIDVLIVGAGPAGLAAAVTLVEAGVAVTLVEDNLQAGGQYFRQLPAAFEVSPTAAVVRDQRRALAALEVLRHPLVTFMPETTVWGVDGERVFAYSSAGTGGRLRAHTVILATGAYDQPQPFPGWTMPGVVSAGGCLNLIKGQGIVPGRRVAVVGNGPLSLVAAYSLLRAGAEVAVVAEAAPQSAMLRQPALLLAPGLLVLGLRYRAALLRAGVPFLGGHAMVLATGEHRVEQVVLAPVEQSQALSRDRSRSFTVDTLVTGYGLAPSTEIARMIGCTMNHDPLLGGWVPNRTGELMTSVDGVYAAGDGAGIGGVEVATVEGRLAARSVLTRLGVQVAPSADGPRLARLNRFRAALAAGYRLPRPLALTTDATIVCRCEEVTQGEIRKAAAACGGDLDRIKSSTRLSMGRCQGRNCLASSATIIARECRLQAEELPPPRMRPPARPIPLASLLTEPLGPAHEPDMPAIPRQFHADAAMSPITARP